MKRLEKVLASSLAVVMLAGNIMLPVQAASNDTTGTGTKATITEAVPLGNGKAQLADGDYLLIVNYDDNKQYTGAITGISTEVGNREGDNYIPNYPPKTAQASASTDTQVPFADRTIDTLANPATPAAQPAGYTPPATPNFETWFGSQPPAVTEYKDNDTRLFTFRNGLSEFNAKALYVGKNCVVWVHDNTKSDSFTKTESIGTREMTYEQAKMLANEFDRNYAAMQTNFGDFYSPDGSGKIAIMCYDIQDEDFRTAGGYFSAGDYIRNKAPMVHLDTYPTMGQNGITDMSRAYYTLFHEYTHLLNFSIGASRHGGRTDGKGNSIGYWDQSIYINEMLAVTAPVMLGYAPLFDYLAEYNGTGGYGLSLVNWDNNAMNYAQAYMLGQYLVAQTGSYSVFHDIINSKYVGREALSDAINKSTASPLKGIEFRELYLNFRTALVLNEPVGIYSFTGSQVEGVDLTNWWFPEDYADTLPGNKYLMPGTSSLLMNLQKKPGSGPVVVTLPESPNVKYYTITKGMPVATIPVESVSLNESNVNLSLGKSYFLYPTVMPSGATNRSVSWSSSDPSVVAVNQTGALSALKVGTATISVKTADGGKTASCKITVSAGDIAVQSVSLNKASLSLNVGATETLSAEILPGSATDKVVTWKSDNSQVASVNTFGTVRALKNGTATITATSRDGQKVASCQVTVSNINVTGLTLDQTKLALDEGAFQTVNATIQPANATNQTITWTTSDSKVATVTQYGRVKGVGPGTATITASCDGKTAAVQVVVTSYVVSGITLNKTAITLDEGASQALTATVLPAHAKDKTVSWYTNNSRVATVTQSGVVTGLTAGTATITAINMASNTEATCTVTVTAKEGALKLSRTSLALSVGLIATLDVTGASGSNPVWSSSAPSVVSVDQQGTLRGVGAGTATITVTDGGRSATCVVTVTGPTNANVPVTGLTVSAGSMSLEVGGTGKLTASTQPSNATNQKITWLTSNSSVVSVSQSGDITAVGAGTATITAQIFDNGFKSASCTVTVTKPPIGAVTGVRLNRSTMSGWVGSISTLDSTLLPSNLVNEGVTWSSSDPSVVTVKDGLLRFVGAGSATITVTTIEGGYTATCEITVKG